MTKNRTTKRVKNQDAKIDEFVGNIVKAPKALFNFLIGDTAQVILGLVCIMFAFYMILSFSSFFFTGDVDQSVIEHMTAKDAENMEQEFTNHAGSLGARLAFFWMNDCFGIPAFFIPLFLLMFGFKLVRAYRVHIWKWFISFTVLMYWLSVTLAYFATPFFSESFIKPGGEHGVYVSRWLSSQIGTPGLIILLITIALVFLIYISNETINMIRNILNPTGWIEKIPYKVNVADGENESRAEEICDDEQQEEKEIIVEQQPISEQDPDPQPVGVVTDLKDEETTEEAPIIEKQEESPKTKKTLPPLPTDPDFTVEISKGNVEATVLSRPYDPTKDLENYKLPTINLLKDYGTQKVNVDMAEQNANKDKIIRVLSSFGVEISSIQATVGPTITLYEITPAEGVRISRIKNLEDDIALSLAALGIRIIAPIPGKGTIGIEVPNKNAQIVPMRDVINSKKFQESKMELPIAFGKTITNEVFMTDLAKAPHMLVAGATGMGKSVGLNAIVTSLLYKKHPAELKFVIIDPKKVEFSVYAPIEKHFLAKLPDSEEAIITDVNKVVQTLKSLCQEMDDRYKLLQKAGVRNIKEYNERFIGRRLNPDHGHRYLPYIVVIIDEFGDLIMTAGREVELPICRLAQLARAIGIHCIIATQRPTTNIITGTIKANFPARVAFRVSDMTNSKVILDKSGAQQLIGRGDMLYLQGSDPVRVQCAFIDTPEVEEINTYISKQQGYLEAFALPEVFDEPEDSQGGPSRGEVNLKDLDSMFREAATLVVTYQQGSTSLIQRKFSIGYNRAGRLMDQLERAGIVGAANGSKAREVLIATEQELETVLQQLNI